MNQNDAITTTATILPKNATPSSSSSGNLYAAHKQWATRPADERFANLQELYEDAKKDRMHAVESPRPIPLNEMRVEADGKTLNLIGKANNPALLPAYAFSQLCARIKAPTGYLATLPEELAALNLNHGIQAAPDDLRSKILLWNNGHRAIRALTGEGYKRIWDYEVIEHLIALQEHGWRVPPARPASIDQPGARPATAADILGGSGNFGGISVKEGDIIAPAGLYRGDRDMFVFMVNEDYRIDDGSERGLARGFFGWNSEVGAASLGIMTFLYRDVCGNHIVWGVSGVSEIRLRHVGRVGARAMNLLGVELRKYADGAASEDELKIKASQRFVIGKDKAEVLEVLFSKFKRAGATLKALDAAYDLAEHHSDTDGNPRSPWGMAQGLTRYSQQTSYASDRVATDRLAGQVLTMAF